MPFISEEFDFKSMDELKKFITENVYSILERYQNKTSAWKDSIKNELTELQRAKDNLIRVGVSFNEKEMNDAINTCQKQVDDANNYYNNIHDLIKEKQNTCTHNWQYKWHDSHYDYYVCPLCGAEDRA